MEKTIVGDGTNAVTANTIDDVKDAVKALATGKTVTIADADGTSNSKTYTVGTSTKEDGRCL